MAVARPVERVLRAAGSLVVADVLVMESQVARQQLLAGGLTAAQPVALGVALTGL